MEIKQCKQINSRARVDMLVLSYHVNIVVPEMRNDQRFLEFAGDKLMIKGEFDGIY